MVEVIRCSKLDISPTASYDITFVRLSARPSVRPSVRPSLTFLKIGSLIVSDIVHDVGWLIMISSN